MLTQLLEMKEMSHMIGLKKEFADRWFIYSDKKVRKVRWTGS